MKTPATNPHAALRHHVTGAIERGESTAIAGIPAAGQAAHILPLVSAGMAYPLSCNSGMWERTIYCRDDRDGGKRFLCEARGDSEQDARNIAAFIVRACNSHAALVAALEQTRLSLAKFASDANYPATVGPWLARIDDALAAAKQV